MNGAPDILWHGAAPAAAGALCVFVHGRGQTPEEMVEMVAALGGLGNVAVALPRAPGKSWYKARAVEPLTVATRDELAASLALLDAAIAAARAMVPGVPMVLAGFSQGACLSIEYALSRGGWDGALVALTGARVGQVGDVRPRAALGGMPVYLTGGDADPWIPVSGWAEAAAEIAQACGRLRAEVFPGRPHEAGAAEIAVMREMLQGLLAADAKGAAA